MRASASGTAARPVVTGPREPSSTNGAVTPSQRGPYWKVVVFPGGADG